MVRPLIIASGSPAAPDRPFKTRQSSPPVVGLEEVETATTGIPHNRVEVGKNGSHPSFRLAGMLKTDCGMALLEAIVAEAVEFVAGAALPLSSENAMAMGINVLRRKKVFMG
jgi:hypothetical protein